MLNGVPTAQVNGSPAYDLSRRPTRSSIGATPQRLGRPAATNYLGLQLKVPNYHQLVHIPENLTAHAHEVCVLLYPILLLRMPPSFLLYIKTGVAQH